MISQRTTTVLARLTLALLLVVGGVSPALAQPDPGGGKPATAARGLPDLDRIDPVRFDYDDALVEFAQVTTRTGTPVGTGTGSPTDQRIWVDIIRPDTDEPVPTILIASPYYNTLGRGWRAELKSPHQGPAVPTSPGAPGLAEGGHVPFPEWYDEYFVPRGYAVALMDLRGTRNSSGCQVYGDRDEVYDVVDVVDWLAEQPWSNGKVGMTGGSYDGTVAIGAAAEAPISARHPEALAAIIPIRAIGRWYDYHFFNGVQSSSHAATPALFTAALAGTDTQNAGADDLLLPYHAAERKACIPTLGAAVAAGYASPYQDATAPFWSERDFLKDAVGIRAATFVIHGLFDFNVKTNNAGYLWEALPDDLPRKLWLMNGDHVDPHAPTTEDARASGHVLPHPFQKRFVEWTHRWYLQFLKGVEAGALRGPEARVQRADGRWAPVPDYPATRRDATWRLTPQGGARPGKPVAGTVAYADGPLSDAPTSATFVSAPLSKDLRLSGQIGFDLTVVTDGPDTTVAVTVLDLPPGTTPDDARADEHTVDRTDPLVVTYGWIRGWYRDSVPLRGVSTPTGGEPISPGEPTRLRFGSLYTDVVVPAGHRLAFVVSNSAGGTVPSMSGGTVTLDTAESRVLLPVAGRRGRR